jgi:hypothetical protein
MHVAVKLKMPPTPTEIGRARAAMAALERLGEEPSELVRTVAEWPIGEASPESEWPTFGR